MSDTCVAFGDRIRSIRKDMRLSQDEFAKRLGTSKQVLSRYETNQRIPKITLVSEYASKLNVPLGYLLGDISEETDFNELCLKDESKSFYRIFIEVTEKMGLNIPGVVKLTGLTDKQVKTIIVRRLKDAPLSLALLLSDTLGVPIEVWTGDMSYTPSNISPEARETAIAYDRADIKEKNIVRLALNLQPKL